MSHIYLLFVSNGKYDYKWRFGQVLVSSKHVLRTTNLTKSLYVPSTFICECK